MNLAREYAREQMELDLKRAEFELKRAETRDAHDRSMDIRLWWTQLLGIIGGLACIGGLIAVAWHYADSGNLTPGLAIFGMGSGLTAGVYGASQAIIRKIAKSRSSSVHDKSLK